MHRYNTRFQARLQETLHKDLQPLRVLLDQSMTMTGIDRFKISVEIFSYLRKNKRLLLHHSRLLETVRAKISELRQDLESKKKNAIYTFRSTYYPSVNSSVEQENLLYARDVLRYAFILEDEFNMIESIISK